MFCYIISNEIMNISYLLQQRVVKFDVIICLHIVNHKLCKISLSTILYTKTNIALFVRTFKYHYLCALNSCRGMHLLENNMTLYNSS